MAGLPAVTEELPGPKTGSKKGRKWPEANALGILYSPDARAGRLAREFHSRAMTIPDRANGSIPDSELLRQSRPATSRSENEPLYKAVQDTTSASRSFSPVITDGEQRKDDKFGRTRTRIGEPAPEGSRSVCLRPTDACRG